MHLHRLSVLTLPLLMACAAPPRPPVTDVTPARPPATGNTDLANYTLWPFGLSGGEALGSAGFSWGLVEGKLDLRGTRATLTLTQTWQTSYVTCPQWGPKPAAQACLDNPRQPSSTRETITLTGDAQWSAGTLMANLRDKDHRVALRCNESPWGLTCSFHDERTIFSRPSMHPGPERVVFAAPGRHRRYQLEPIKLKDALRRDTPLLSGRLEVNGPAGATLTLAAEGKPPVELRGSASPGDGTRLRFEDTEKRITLNCEEGQRRVVCKLTANPGLFDLPSFWGDVVVTAED